MLFSALFVQPELADAVSERAWITAMLDAESALAWAEARVGVIPASAAAEIETCCVVERIDYAAINAQARQVGNPVEPLARALRQLVSEDTARYVHYGATSQDILDTASMLVTKRSLSLIEPDLTKLAGVLAFLTNEHQDTVMVGRTLLQHALPSTFGLKTAGWLAGVSRAQAGLRHLHSDCLVVELGGASGTLAWLGNAGIAVLREYAQILQLKEPSLPWHTERTRIAEIAAALGLVGGTTDKIALDITLLSQTEVREVTERGGEMHGGSSTMPQKRNAVGSVLTRSCVRQAQGNIEVLMRSMEQEHERAAGAWHAEWQALTGALAFTGGAVSWLGDVMINLEVHPERMRENLNATRGLVMAERVTLVLTERMGRDTAHQVIRSASRKTAEGGGTFRDALLSEDSVRSNLSVGEIEALLDPATYLGSARAFIDRALALHGNAGISRSDS